MEELPKPATQGSSAEKQTPFIRSWLALRSGMPVPPEALQSPVETDDDDEEEEDEDSPERASSQRRRVRDGLSRLIRRLVPPPRLAGAAEMEPPQAPQETPSIERVEQPTLPAFEAFGTSAQLPEQAPIATQGEYQPSLWESPTTLEQPSAPESTEPPTTETSLAQPLPPEAVSAPSVHPEVQAQLLRPRQEFSGAVSPSVTEVNQRVDRLEKTVQDQENSREKRGVRAAWFAFLGGELFSRRRDRKLRREQAATQRRINQLEQQQLVQRAERLRAQTSSAEVKPTWRPPAFERPAHAQLEKRPLVPAEQLTTVVNSERTTKPPETVPEQYRHLIEHEGAGRPEVVLKEVEQAAEKNIPLENLLERRHEVKDGQVSGPADDQPMVSGGAPHVGQILDAPDFERAQAIARRMTVEETPPQPLYQQAVKSGIITAVAILAILLILFFFVR